MIKTGLVGYGYWGKILESKLDMLSDKIFVQNSKNYNSEEFRLVEWVFIATPLASHFDIVGDCLSMGANVFVEKPFCASVEQAEKLLFQSSRCKKLLYINNVFLYRSELTQLIKCRTNFKVIEFLWCKYGPFNDTLINDLFYHDLYILIHLVGIMPISQIKVLKNEFNILCLHFFYGDILIKVNYDRTGNFPVQKSLILDDQLIIFKKDQQDPLKDIISGCLDRSIDFDYNHLLNLHVMKLMHFFSNI